MQKTDRKEEIVTFLKNLRDEIIAGFESVEEDGKFQREPWEYKKGYGGGEMSVIRGKTFEKAAVNWSGVGGDDFPMNDGSGPFFATGVSLITHMSNPHAPTVHFNIRYMKAGDREWIGGGYDLTPMGCYYEEDKVHFHKVAKETLEKFGKDLYPDFFEQAKEYYYIKHWERERGVGGIFFDHLNSGDFDKDLEMWKAVGKSFLDAILPIYKKRVNTPFTEEEKAEQLRLRGQYAEFNLVYDRGTKFGFLSGGNPRAILCSMPPVATW